MEHRAQLIDGQPILVPRQIVGGVGVLLVLVHGLTTEFVQFVMTVQNQLTGGIQSNLFFGLL